MSAAISTTAGVRPDAPPASDARTIAATIIGNAFEFYDFAVYAIFASIIGRAFFPAENPSVSLLLSVATFGVGFVARPLGGIVIGAYADRYGRKPAMTLTIWLMALGSGMIGILPTYGQIGLAAPLLLVLARLIQGFSAGGEMGPATSTLIESAPRHRVAFYGSWQLSSQNMGSTAGAILGALLGFLIGEQGVDAWGWRIPFLLGILIAPVGLYIRSRLHETLDAEQAHESMAGVLGDLFGRHLGKIVLAILLISGGTISQYFFLYVTPYAITTLGLSVTVAMLAGVAVGVTGIVFSLVGGVLADRFGIKRVSIAARLVTTLLMYPMMLLVLANPSPAILIGAMSTLMAFHAISSAAGIVMIPLAFPARVRTAGLSIAYAAGVTIFGGTAQVIFTWLIGASGSKLAPIWWVVAASVISIVATVLLRVETADARAR